MNKKKAKELEDTRKALAEARALSWPSYSAPQPIDPRMVDCSYDKATTGWYAHFYATTGKRVTLGRFTTVWHSDNADGGSKSQGPGRFFMSEADAWRQVRVEATQCFAKVLAEIDAEIIKAETGVSQ